MRRVIRSPLVVTLLILGCNAPDTPYTVHRLPSGREVKIIGTGKMVFTQGDPALMLKYRTDLPIDDRQRLRKEVEEVWQMFRVSVEQAGLRAAIISAHTAPKRTLLITTNKSYNFVLRRLPTGHWEFLGDG